MAWIVYEFWSEPRGEKKKAKRKKMFLACHENFLSLIDWELFQVELCLGFIIRRVKDDMVLLATDRESELVKDNISWV